MSDTLVVLNAGSSSVKFSLFFPETNGPTLVAHGQIESIGTAPRFSARDAAGIVLGARVPIVLTSRADSLRTRLASCAVAVLFAEANRTEAADALSGANESRNRAG